MLADLRERGFEPRQHMPEVQREFASDKGTDPLVELRKRHSAKMAARKAKYSTV